MKIANIIIAILFIVFAVVQFNDPDPLKWVGLYAFVGVLALFAAFGWFRRWVILAGMAIFIIEFIRLIPDFMDWLNMGAPTITGSMKATEPHIELTREFLGIFICIVALGFLYWQSVKYRALNAS